MSNNTSAHVEVAVIGAGQAGLAIGHFLSLQGRRFVILEAEDSVAAAWRTRWDSLVLFTPRRYDSLPGRVFPGDPDGYPTRDEVIAYLDDYAEALALPGPAWQRCSFADEEGRHVRARPRRPDTRGRPGRRRDRAVPEAATAPVRHRPRPRGVSDPQRQLPRRQPISRKGRFWSSAAGTRATRSRASSRQHTTSISQSAAARRRCRRDFSAATSSGGL